MTKKLSAFILIPLLTSSVALAKVSASDLVKKLEGYQDGSVTSSVDKELSESQMKEQDALFSDLREAVKVSIKEPKNAELRKEAIRVASLMLEKDPSAYSAEVILPLYKFNKKSFVKDAEFLGKDKAKDLVDAIKDAEKESAEGNG